MIVSINLLKVKVKVEFGKRWKYLREILMKVGLLYYLNNFKFFFRTTIFSPSVNCILLLLCVFLQFSNDSKVWYAKKNEWKSLWVNPNTTLNFYSLKIRKHSFKLFIFLLNYFERFLPSNFYQFNLLLLTEKSIIKN